MLRAALVHSLPGRARFRVSPPELRLYQHSEIARLIADTGGVLSASVNPLSGSVLVYFDPSIISLSGVAAVLRGLAAPRVQGTGAVGNRQPPYVFAAAQLLRFFYPPALRPLFTVLTALPFLIRGLRSLGGLRMDVPLLDASAVTLNLIQGDYRSASTLTALLKTGEYLEEWAKYRSRENLAEKLSVHIGNVWLRRGKEDREIPCSQLQVGDRIVIRTGAMVPVDGRVVSGGAMVNEASMTGEALAALREKGASIHAGTVVEEGEIVVEVRKKGEDTRYQKILAMIAQSENSKADTELNARRFADRLVPFSFLTAGATVLFSGNLEKARAVLSVDYSCPIKLSTPLVFLSGIREGLNNGVFFKGGASMEALAKVDTIVFDKTGTLTKAAPALIKTITYGGFDERQALKTAACLEEHFPHPVAKSIVRYAKDRGIEHREEHNTVKYIAAHGIVTEYQGKRTVIGSRHFIREDEHIDISAAAGDEAVLGGQGKSLLYLAVDGVLAAVFVIDDPPREEAAEVVAMLRRLGLKRLYLLSGDNKSSVERIAKGLGLDSFRGELLPDEKAEIIRSLRKRGLTVAMVGDGINDSPAMAAADVGIAMKEGADLSRETADITLKSPSLYPLVIARLIAERAIGRIRTNIGLAVGINSALMLAGVLGNSAGSTSMVLHNLSTLLLSLNSMRPFLPGEDGRR
ncbi:MAG: heavy metal translocating P-type ATPase [Treponema sp.]|nr:heavy metal translocating P-type ATPase [Treponema sp.]